MESAHERTCAVLENDFKVFNDISTEQNCIGIQTTPITSILLDRQLFEYWAKETKV